MGFAVLFVIGRDLVSSETLSENFLSLVPMVIAIFGLIGVYWFMRRRARLKGSRSPFFEAAWFNSIAMVILLGSALGLSYLLSS